LSSQYALRSKDQVVEALRSGRIAQDTHDQLLKTFPEEDPSNPLEVNDDDAQLTWIKKTLAGR
jgi:hypothetical protein